MAEEPSAIVNTALREGFDRPLAAVREQLSARLSREFVAAQESAAAEAARTSEIATAQAFSHAARRLRHAASLTEAGTVLLESAGAYCGRAALLVLQGANLVGWRSVGFAAGGNGSWTKLHIPRAEAPALAEAIENRETTVTKLVAGRISAALADTLAAGPDEQGYLIPISLRRKAVAILYADAVGARNRMQPAALELLCLIAEASFEVLDRRPTPAASTAEAPVQGTPVSSEPLSSEHHDLQARAQRVARLLVADLMLNRFDQVRQGREAKNLYGYLKQEIDSSREVYHRKFRQLVEAGQDYFHAEVLRTLAANQVEVLGPEYPGPLRSPIP